MNNSLKIENHQNCKKVNEKSSIGGLIQKESNNIKRKKGFFSISKKDCL